MTRGTGPSWRITIRLGAICQNCEREYAILFAATLLCARKLNQQLDSDRPSPAKVAAVGMMRLLWSNEFRDIDSSNSVDAPLPSPGSVENLKNVKGVTWSHGPSMERPCLEVGAKNYSTRNLKLLQKRSWNCLSYSRSMRPPGTPSNSTNVL